MVSPELLRQYPHFAGVTEDCLKKIAMVSEKRGFQAGEDLLIEGNTATKLCLMISGEVNVIYRLGDDREVVADSLVKGDSFGWSALLEPHILTASCRGHKDGEIIEIEALSLRSICDEDIPCGYQILNGVAKTLRDRLSAMRVQIAAQA
jgi:CRP-like cAMP-binding protein